MNMTDNEIIFRALSQWANYIETGDVVISAADAIRMDNPDSVKPLTLDQQKHVIRLRDLAAKYLQS